MRKKTQKTAGRRFLKRLLSLLVVASATYFLQVRFEQDGDFWLLVFELLIYALFGMIALRRQTGRLKSRPDTSKVTGEQLMDEEPLVVAHIGIYLFLLMLLILGKLAADDPIDITSMGPWGFFIAAAPMFVIVFWHQYKLESVRELR